VVKTNIKKTKNKGFFFFFFFFLRNFDTTQDLKL
jgi:hypothetical protein